MKEHTLIGASMLDKLEHYKDEKMIKVAYQICRWHHERYDGKGYPDGLTGEQIPIAAQVVSVADVYDALVSKRVYKDAYSHEQAMKMILNGECGAFNPLLMEVLVEIQDKIKEEMPDLFGVQEETHAWEDYLRPEFEKYGYDFDYITINQFYDSGEIYPGYAALPERELKHQYNIYDSTFSTIEKGQYINGGLTILKKHIHENMNGFNELLLHNEAEDVELAYYLRFHGIIPRINIFSTAYTIGVPLSRTAGFIDVSL